MADVVGIADIEIYAGDYFEVDVFFKTVEGETRVVLPVPATGWAAHIREEFDRKVHSYFDVDATAGPTLGKLVLSLPAARTQDLPSGVWDLEVIEDGKTLTYIGGTITVKRDVTHAR